jgi:hypothetical protein
MGDGVWRAGFLDDGGPDGSGFRFAQRPHWNVINSWSQIEASVPVKSVIEDNSESARDGVLFMVVMVPR